MQNYFSNVPLISKKMDVTEKILQYQSFIDENLMQDLKDIEGRLNRLYSEETEYSQLKSSVQAIKENYKEGFKTQVEVGCDMFIQAEVSNVSEIIVDVGLGYHLEMDTEETIRYSDIRLNILKLQIEHALKQTIKIKGHIKLVLLAIHELKNKSNPS